MWLMNYYKGEISPCKYKILHQILFSCIFLIGKIIIQTYYLDKVQNKPSKQLVLTVRPNFILKEMKKVQNILIFFFFFWTEQNILI